jgi:hypothetical protein
LNKLNIVVTILFVLVILESATIAYPYLSGSKSTTTTLLAGPAQSYSYPYSTFNQPISNDTDAKLQPNYNGSWSVDVRSSFIGSASSEAQLAIAPNFRTENLSIPTIIIQEKMDGQLRIEYYAQNWNNTFGLILYNSSSPSWMGQNVSLKFVVFGPPSQVNPQIAPRPNGNLTITVGTTVVLSDYPIAWASLAHIYLYGLRGSAFTTGSMAVTFRGLSVG